MSSSSWTPVRALAGASRRFFSARAGAGGIAGPKITGALRFYKDVGVQDVGVQEEEEEEGGEGAALGKRYAVTLDGKTVKTPRQQPMQLPTRAMAYAVAHEWDAQKRDIRPATMPIMTLASTALDLLLTSSREETVGEMLHYLHTDTVCYEVTADHQEKLVALQQKKWKPLRKWFSDTFGGDVDVSHGSIDPLGHDQQLVANVRAFLEKLNEFELAATRTLTKECKSLITALAVFTRHITAKEAIDVCRLEEEFQINNWGLVEGGHDLDRVNCAVKLSSASLLLYLLENKD